MVQVNRKEVSLYKEAKAGLSSLIKQTGQVFAGLILILILTRGNPPGWIVASSFFIGIAFVAWSENKRTTKRIGSADLSGADLSDETNETKLDEKWHKVWEIVNQPEANRNLSGANLSGANLSSANLRSADLRSANLSNANLITANLSNANLSNANLSGADLSSAELLATNLTNADLSNAKVRNACFRDNLGIPESLKSNLIARGAIFEDFPQVPTPV